MKNNTESQFDATVQLPNIEPLRMVTRTFGKGEERITPLIQYVMYAENLAPDQKRSLSKVLLVMEHLHITYANLAELFGEGDLVSELKSASYKVEKFLIAISKKTLTLFDKKCVTINVNCSPNCKNAVFDIRRLELILYNIISNAIVHNPKKEKLVNIDADYKDDNLIITVTDNGRGISAKDAKSFLNIQPPKLKKLLLSYDFNSGTIKGLSLYVSKKLAADMGGTIQSLPYTKGAKIEITVPQNISDPEDSVGYAELMEPESYTLSDIYARRCLCSAMLKELEIRN